MTDGPVTTRFAPSPSGLLHIGHAWSALQGYRAARAHPDGRFLLRIEDIDTDRCRPEYERAIMDDMTWLGLAWDGPVRRQSEHLDDYRAALGELEALDLVYPCFCTRQEIRDEVAASASAPHGPLGLIYPGTCRQLTPSVRRARLETDTPFALRLDMRKAIARVSPLSWNELGQGRIYVDISLVGDVVIARKETAASYHLSVAVDDNVQGITLVTRGRDLFHATHVHRMLQALLGYDPPDYQHPDLLLDAEGKRFAKRDHAVTLQALREAGHTADEVIAMAEELAKSGAPQPAGTSR
jgi:glutamyl-Q tRNA(Asp) synthetase